MNPIPELTDSDLARFWAKVDKSSDCWLWTGFRDKRGYGRFQMRGTVFLATRIMYTIKYNDPGNLNVCHKCDNPQCVNPNHLWLGTQRDNLKDCSQKERMPRGEDKYQAKLTEEDVLAIRHSKESRIVMAEQYGCTVENISHIRLKKTWKHLEN